MVLLRKQWLVVLRNTKGISQTSLLTLGGLFVLGSVLLSATDLGKNLLTGPKLGSGSGGDTEQLVSDIDITYDPSDGYIILLPEKSLAEKRAEIRGGPTPPSVVQERSALLSHRDTLRSSQERALQTLKKTAVSFKERKRFQTALNAIHADLGEDDIRLLREKGYKVYRNEKVQAILDKSVALIGASDVWKLTDSSGNPLTGKGIKVAIIDTGIDYTHRELGGCLGAGCKVAGGYDFINNDADPMDDHGHGTHVASIAAGNGILKGVAPEATLYAYKVLNAAGFGSWDGLISAIERAIDPNQDGDFSDRADVLNLSLGGGGDPDSPAALAVDNAVRAGSAVAVSAGNSGPSGGTIITPGNSRLGISVAATDKSDILASFSSRGPVVWNAGQSTIMKPDVSAPGVSICAAQWQDAFGNNCLGDKELTAISGTSMAAPHIAGVAALIKQAHPNWSPLTIKSVIKSTALDLVLEPYEEGVGRVRALVAVEQNTPPTAHLNPIEFQNDSWVISGTIESGSLSYWSIEAASVGGNVWQELFRSTSLPSSSELFRLSKGLLPDGRFNVRLRVEEKDSDRGIDYGFIDTTTSPAGPLEILLPAGGEAWPFMSTQQIQWRGENKDALVIVYLAQGEKELLRLVSVIAAYIPNSGSFSWPVPSDQFLAGNYRIAIQCVFQCAHGVELALSNSFKISPIIISRRVNSSRDDAEEKKSNGSMMPASYDLELGTHIVGVRFTKIAIPPGASIREAYIEFDPDKKDSTSTSIVIAGHNVGNSPQFSLAAFDISSRTQTSSKVPWVNIPPWDNLTAKHRTPNLASIVQEEIINRKDWQSGNSMTFIITGSGRRAAESYNRSLLRAPLLYIEVGPPLPAPLSLLKPNGGEKWVLGNTHTISWNPYNPKSGLNIYPDVQAYLDRLENGSFVEVGKVLPAGKASIHWDGEINSYGNYAPPGDYYIRLVNSKTGETDRSDAPFELLPSDALKADLKLNGSDGYIPSPPGNEPVEVTAEWSFNVDGGCTIYTNADPGSPDWVIRDLLPSGSRPIKIYPNKSGYDQAIILTCFSKIPEGSARDSVLVSTQGAGPLIKVLSPNGDEEFDVTGSTYIKTSYPAELNLTGISFMLYKNDASFKTIVADLPVFSGSSSTLYLWRLSDTLKRSDLGVDTPGTIFKVYAIGKTGKGGTVTDISDRPFSIFYDATPGEYQEIDLLVVMESEFMKHNVPQGIYSWVRKFAEVASGGAFMEAVPNNNTLSPDGGALMEYIIHSPKSQNYYLWVRGRDFQANGNNNSVHFSANGSIFGVLYIPENGAWNWANSLQGGGRATINVKQGQNFLGLHMREDGIQIDKIILTPLATYEPLGQDLPETRK